MPDYPVDVLDGATAGEVRSKFNERRPVLVRNWDVGPCVRTWTRDYVSNKVGSDPVKIHVSASKRLDFVRKNFKYQTLPFDELVRRIFQSRQPDHFIDPMEVYYLRSLGNDRRGKDVANFFRQVPALATDLKVPSFFDDSDLFSAVFRASSDGLQLWTHYDVMDNILIQVTGRKRVILWPPSEVHNLYLIGDKSEVLDVDNPDPVMYPKFRDASRYECVMQPGDVLFIPALWFHNTIAQEPCLAVNVFWKNLSHDLYDKHDPYGNKDLLPAAKALQAVDSATRSLRVLPTEYRTFYVLRMIKMLEKELSSEEDVP